MKGIVSLSGGRDSATLLAYVVKELGAENVYAVSFEYGSKHPQELLCAKHLAEYYGVPHQIINIDPDIFAGSNSTLLAGREEVQKDMTYDEIIEKNGEGKVDTYIPARNFLFSAYCAAIAESKHQETGDDVTVYLAQHADDAAGHAYPDCSPEFNEAVNKVTMISSENHVKQESPFIKINKGQVLQKAIELGVPLEHTFSCYEPIIKDGYAVECGRCATCLDVKKALEANGKEYIPTRVKID